MFTPIRIDLNHTALPRYGSKRGDISHVLIVRQISEAISSVVNLLRTINLKEPDLSRSKVRAVVEGIP